MSRVYFVRSRATRLIKIGHTADVEGADQTIRGLAPITRREEGDGTLLGLAPVPAQGDDTILGLGIPPTPEARCAQNAEQVLRLAPEDLAVLLDPLNDLVHAARRWVAEDTAETRRGLLAQRDTFLLAERLRTTSKRAPAEGDLDLDEANALRRDLRAVLVAAIVWAQFRVHEREAAEEQLRAAVKGLDARRVALRASGSGARR